MKKKLFREVHVEAEREYGNYEFDLEYFLLEKETEAEHFTLKTYGVEIDKSYKDEKQVFHKEYRKVYDLFCTEEEAKEILEKLARNAVTPIALMDVLENLIGMDEFVVEESTEIAG